MISKKDILLVTRGYIGVNSGYLGDFSYRTHEEFYPLYCDLEIYPSEYEGTTRERFEKILESVDSVSQVKILKGVLKKYPVEYFPEMERGRKKQLEQEIINIINRLENSQTKQVQTNDTIDGVTNINIKTNDLDDTRAKLNEGKILENDKTEENNQVDYDKIVSIFVKSLLKTLTIAVILVLLFKLGLLLYRTVDKDKFIELLKNFILDDTGKTVSLAIIVLIGISLFLFKKNQQFWYGIVETLFALFGCYASTAWIKTIVQTGIVEPSYIVAFGSSIYLVVRGLTNVEDGGKKKFWLKGFFDLKFMRSILEMISDIPTLQTRAIAEALGELTKFLIK